jgi:hypothetical protein
MIESYIKKLGFAVRDPVRHTELRTLYARKDFTGMAAMVRKTMNLNMRLRIGLVNTGGRTSAPAWVQFPVPMPAYGTEAFKRTLVTMYLRKSFLEMHDFEVIVSAIAHELSHVLLQSVNHVLQLSEEAVDLTAMMLGYRDFYRLGSATLETDEYVLTRSYGYLSEQEITYAANIMATM